MGGSPLNSGYTEVPQQAPQVEVSVVAPVITTATPTAEEQLIIRKATNGLLFVCFVQLVAGFMCMLYGGFFYTIITAIFVSMGMSGARKLRTDHLAGHFAFTLVLYILSLVALVCLFTYGQQIPLSLIFALFAWIFVQILGLKSARILIDMSRKYKDAGLPMFLANNKCCSKNACATSSAQQQQVPPSYNEFVAANPNMTFVPMQSAVDPSSMNVVHPSLAVPQYAPYMYVPQPAEGYIYVPAAEIDVEQVNSSAAYPGQFKPVN